MIVGEPVPRDIGGADAAGGWANIVGAASAICVATTIAVSSLRCLASAPLITVASSVVGR
jgi:hypothetical protein